MHKHVAQKYMPSFLFGAVLLLLLYLVKPYAIAILSAVVLAVIFYPLYKKFTKYMNHSLASLSTCVTIVISIFLPILLIIQALTIEITKLIKSGVLDKILEQVQNPIIHVFDMTFDVTFVVDKSLLYAQQFLESTIASLPERFLIGFVTIFLCYYFLKDGSKILEGFLELFAISKKHKQKIVERFSVVAYGVVYGQILTAVAQGIVATIGYMFLGLPSPILLGILTTFVAFIPIVGTGFVWAPVALYLFMIGDYSTAVILSVYGALIVGLVDNFLRPYFISDQTKMHPALVLLGVVCGIQAFGIIGMFVGPLIIVLSQQLLVIYGERKSFG
jgi:predicted PurR-regulated permease PerM